MDELPNALAKHLNTIKVVMFGENEVAMLSAAWAAYETTKIVRWPYTSEKGAQISRPRANLKTNNEAPGVATSPQTGKF